MKVMPNLKILLASICTFSVIALSAPDTARSQMNLAPSDKRTVAMEQFKYTGNRKLLEVRKIQYLITLVSESPYSFIRNGKSYTSKQAAAHLRFKYSRSGGRIENARQFIDYVASKSLLTGQPYFIETAGGDRFPIDDLLVNELQFLEQKIQVH